MQSVRIFIVFTKGVFLVSQRQSAQRDTTQHNDPERCSLLQRLCRIPSYIGHCTAMVLGLIPLFGSRIVKFSKAFLHGCFRILHLFWRILRTPIHLQLNIATIIERQLRAAKGTGFFGWCKAIIRSLHIWLWNDNGLLVTLFRYAAPMVCIAFFCSVVIYGESIEYGIAVEFNGKTIGYIADESDYYKAYALASERLSYANAPVALPTQHTLTVVQYDGTEPYQTAASLADAMLRTASISLTDAYGVYRGDVFLGAVEDTTIIRESLSEQLTAYSSALSVESDAVYYAEEVSYVHGTYLTESLSDAQNIADSLTAQTTRLRTVTIDKDTSVYAVAARYTMAVDDLYALNPSLTEHIAAGTSVTVSLTEYALPIAYTTTRSIVSVIPYDTLEIETSALPIGERKILSAGQLGETSNIVEVTYINGVETSHNVLQSTLISEPVAEQVSVGTYAAKPASTATKLYGTGEYSWPLNGGYISDPYISNRNHRGLDIAAPVDTEIYAAATGVVRIAGWNSQGYGYYIIIEHGDGYETLYAHCNQLLTNVGETVTKGQLIGLVGSTGNSTGNHLHFEVRYNGVNQNPADYLRVNAD